MKRILVITLVLCYSAFFEGFAMSTPHHPEHSETETEELNKIFQEYALIKAREKAQQSELSESQKEQADQLFKKWLRVAQLKAKK